MYDLKLNCMNVSIGANMSKQMSLKEKWGREDFYL